MVHLYLHLLDIRRELQYSYTSTKEEPRVATPDPSCNLISLIWSTITTVVNSFWNSIPRNWIKFYWKNYWDHLLDYWPLLTQHWGYLMQQTDKADMIGHQKVDCLLILKFKVISINDYFESILFHQSYCWKGAVYLKHGLFL